MFGGTYCRHLHGWIVRVYVQVHTALLPEIKPVCCSITLISALQSTRRNNRRWRQIVSSKRWYLPYSRNGVTTEDGGSVFLRNVGIYLTVGTTLQPKMEAVCSFETLVSYSRHGVTTEDGGSVFLRYVGIVRVALEPEMETVYFCKFLHIFHTALLSKRPISTFTQTTESAGLGSPVTLHMKPLPGVWIVE
jgi:hypothetical protein